MNYESFGICQTVGRYGIFEPYFFIKKVWTKNFRIGRSDIDVHTYKSMQNTKIPPRNSKNYLPKDIEKVLYPSKKEGPTPSGCF